MKYILALGFIILSLFVYGNKCLQTFDVSNMDNETLSELIFNLTFSKTEPLNEYKLEPQHVDEDYEGFLIEILTKLAASGKGPNCKLLKINSIDKIYTSEGVTYSYNANFTVENVEENYTLVHIREEAKPEDGYFIYFYFTKDLIFRRIRPSGKVEAINPLFII